MINSSNMQATMAISLMINRCEAWAEITISKVMLVGLVWENRKVYDCIAMN